MMSLLFIEYLLNLSFSQCGDYIYSVDSATSGKPEWPELYLVNPDSPLGESSPAGLQQDGHPTIIERDLCYVHAPFMYRIWNKDQNGVVRLDRKHIDAANDDFKSRYIGVIPDLHLSRLVTMIFAIWPQDPAGEVKLLIKPDRRTGHPTLINTGIMSEDLLGERGWVDDSALE